MTTDPLTLAREALAEAEAPKCGRVLFYTAGLAQRCAQRDGHDGVCSIVVSYDWPGWCRAALAEVDDLKRQLTQDNAHGPQAGGWCGDHPMRVERDTAGMVGRDTSDGADLCLACEVLRLERRLAAAERVVEAARWMIGPLAAPELRERAALARALNDYDAATSGEEER